MKIIIYKFSGVKNISTEQEIQFLKNKRESLTFISEEQLFELEDNNIRGIFGLNGSGKSATISPLFVLRDLVMNKFIIENPNSTNHTFIKELISKKSMSMKIEIEFLVEQVLYNMFVELKNKEDMIYIASQKLEKKENFKGRRKITVFQSFDKSSFFLLRDSSIKTEENDLKNIINFFSNFIMIPSNNEQLNFESTTSIELPKDLIQHIKETENNNKMVLNLGSKTVIEDIDKYKKRIKFFKFLLQKKLKYDLVDIKVEYRKVSDKNDQYIIEDIIMQYDYDVSIRNESSGIKRLFNIFEAVFLNIENEKLIIIDEIDIYFHNSLIKDMIRYIKFYSKCQFIFVTHDLMLMNEIDDLPKTIILVKKDHTLATLPAGNGNTILNKYLNGLFEDEYNMNLYDIFRESK